MRILNETVEGLQNGLDISLKAEQRLQNLLRRLQEENDENARVLNEVQAENKERGSIIERLEKEAIHPKVDAAVDGLIARLLTEAETATKKVALVLAISELCRNSSMKYMHCMMGTAFRVLRSQVCTLGEDLMNERKEVARLQVPTQLHLKNPIILHLDSS